MSMAIVINNGTNVRNIWGIRHGDEKAAIRVRTEKVRKACKRRKREETGKVGERGKAKTRKDGRKGMIRKAGGRGKGKTRNNGRKGTTRMAAQRETGIVA